MDLSLLIERLARKVASRSEPSDARDAALATMGLPVYEDMGGVLVLTPQGEVQRYDPDTKMVQIPEEKWRVVALARAARFFPELRALAPPRPPDAVVCQQCLGNGTILGGVGCGVCLGLGWTAP